jgi:RHS repeat-associated protein
MPSNKPPVSAFKQLIGKPLHLLHRRRLQRKLICCALIFNILLWPGRASTVESITELSSSVGYSITTLSTGSLRMSSAIFELLLGAPRRPQEAETLADRLAAVAHIRISPSRFVGYEGGGVTLTAQPTDYLDRSIQGVRFTWESSNTNKVEIDEMGRARFIQPGLARVTCRAGSVEATAVVLVRPGRRPRQTDEEWQADQSSLQANADPSNSRGGVGSTTTALSSLLDKLSPTAHAQSAWANDLAYDQLWSEPRNLVGSPRNRAIEATAIGPVLPEGSNFNWALPLVNLSGRGLNLNLTLYYNSRIWSRRNNTLAFDAITGWPAPGFSLGFGRIVFYTVGTTGKYLLIDPDGTRHYLGSGPWDGNGGYASGGPLETSDGTHIVYTGNARDGGDLHYPDGTTVVFTTINNRILPTSIIDKSGNYIQIAYKPDCYQVGTETYCGVFPPTAIDYIIDTLGRRIEFQYDSGGKLISITRPGFGGTTANPVTTTVAQFDYQTLTASTNFTGLTVERGLTWTQTIKHIYLPATGTGYKPSYSQYGMIYNVSTRRQMTSSTWPPGTPPTITDGVESASVAFNYPTSSQTALVDAPAFTQRTESAVNSPTAVYSYSAASDTLAQTATFTITRPDTTTVSLTRSTNGASAANGLVVQSETKINSTSLAKTVLNYVNDGGGSPQAQSVISYDDTATPIKADFDYDQYGNVTNKREYGYQINGAWQVRRRTHYTYKTDSGYISIYLRGLVTLVELFDALENTADSDDALIAKTSYAYDNFMPMGGLENYGGPTSPPPAHVNYGPYGKVTGVTEWADFAAPTPTVIQRLAKIDIFGNVVKAQVSCCQEKDLTNREATYWSKPSEETSGDPNGVHQTTSTDYDFNTSLAKSNTNASGLVTNFAYDAMMTPASVTLPTGASSQRITDYATLSSTSSIGYDDGGMMKTLTSITNYDGWGRVIQTVDRNNSQVNTGYDAMGRVTSRTNPFLAGGTPGPTTTTQYDIANRAVITTLPDGNVMRTDYSGNSVTATDQVGRKIKRDTDGLGRLVKITEQDATGALAQETSYTYSLLDKLTLVDQGSQQRRYKYDALGRLLFERIPEQSPTINDGAGTLWSTKYTYTEFGAVSTRQDARGVVTSYGYDALHRVSSISYDTANAAGVASTPSVSLNYDTSGSLSGVTVGNQFTETYNFDSFHRVQSVTRWILGQVNDSRKTYTTSYEYNQAGQLTKVGYPSGFHVDPSYDNKGRPAALLYDKDNAWQGGYMTNLTYDTAGQVAGLSLGNGVAETYSYDSQRLQMTSQTATKGGNTLMSLTYGYQGAAGQNGANTTAGNSGQLMSVSGTINSTTESASYSYDLLGRLVTSSQTSNGLSAQRRFAYDRWGNRTGVWNATSGGSQIQSSTLEQSGGAPTNRITSVTNSGVTSNYTYDAAGNVINDGQHAYQYDAENRVVSVDSGAAQYRYDHENRRVCKIIGAAWTHYIYEGSQCIAEHDGTQSYTTNPTYQANSARVDYIYSASRMIYRRQRTSSGGQWTTNYYLSARLSARLVLDTTGNVVGRQAHLPFGEDFAASGAQEKHHFTSYERDSESGLDYAINRGYASLPGRFMQIDPVAGTSKDPKNLNRYAYVHNDPLNAVDRDGLSMLVLDCGYRVVGGTNGEFVIQYTCTASSFGESTFVPPEPVIDYNGCLGKLAANLRSSIYKDKSIPSIGQVRVASMAAAASKIDVSILLLLWWKENSFQDNGPNNSRHYGPGQVSEVVARQFRRDSGYNLSETLGDVNSPTFTGSTLANLTVGGMYLNYLAIGTGGDMALAFVRYQNPGANLDHSGWSKSLEDRFNKFNSLIESFKSFAQCVKDVDERLYGGQ